jgi:dolichol-phosphate mannosyltransferase
MEGRPPAPAGRRLSLVLPAHNEEAGVRRAVAEADDALARLAADYEILVVDDGSRDGTAAAAAAAAAGRPRVRLLRHEANRGYGAALRTGFAAARFELIAFTDADSQFHAADLCRLLPLTDRAPVAVGWRYARKDVWLRRILSRGYNLLTRALLGTRVRDCDCALKVFRREALAELLPETDGFFVNVEMLTRARLLGLDVAEAGVRHRPRGGGASKVGWRDVPRTLAALVPFWWSHVLFPGGGARGVPRPTTLQPAGVNGSPLPGLALVLVVAALLFFTRLTAPLLEPQEPRYAQIPREMLAQGRFLTPVLAGQPYFDKPPLLYWAVMASYAVFGVHDWSARLTPALAGVLTVGVVYLWGRRALGGRAGLCGALVLCLSAQFVYLGRMLTIDGLLCLWVTAGLAAAHAALAAARLGRGWWLLSAAACGMGVLTKGPVALVLVLGPTAAYYLLEPRRARLTWAAWRDWMLTLAAVAGPWYVATALTERDFVEYFLWKHNVLRFVAPFDHPEPAWFYGPPLLLGLLPWGLLLPGLARWLLRRSPRSTARRPPALGFFLLAFTAAFLFFSAAGGKRTVYILPALPPLALALGCYLDVLAPRGADWRAAWARLWRRGSRLAFAASVLVAVFGGGAALAAVSLRLLAPAAGVALAVVALAAVVVLTAARRVVSWPVCAATTLAALLAGVLVLLPAYNQRFSLRPCLSDLPRKAPLRVACFPRRWESVDYYLPNARVRVYGAGEEQRLFDDLRADPDTLLLVKTSELKQLESELPPSLMFVPRAGQGVMTAGWVRTRGRPADGRLARR